MLLTCVPILSKANKMSKDICFHHLEGFGGFGACCRGNVMTMLSATRGPGPRGTRRWRDEVLISLGNLLLSRRSCQMVECAGMTLDEPQRKGGVVKTGNGPLQVVVHMAQTATGICRL
jgi:hypothetical protein